MRIQHFPVLFFWWPWFGFVLLPAAEVRLPDHWSVLGSFQCSESQGISYIKAGWEADFFACQGSQFAISAYTFAEPMQEHQAFVLDNLAAGDRVLVDFEVDFKMPLLSEHIREIYSVVRQEENTQGEPPTLAHVALAVYFASQKYGFDRQEVSECFAAGGPLELKTKNGLWKATVNSSGLQSISIVKGAEDLFIDGKRQLKEVTIPPFSQPLSSLRCECVFKEPVDLETSSGWEAETSVTFADAEGNQAWAKFQVQVSDFRSDLVSVDNEVEKILSWIPDSTRVVARDRVMYEWKDGEIEPALDENALLAAGKTVFRSRVILTTFVVFLFAASFLVYNVMKNRS